MELKARTELRHVLAPQLQQSLKILALPYLELKAFLEEEVRNNPLLEEESPKTPPSPLSSFKKSPKTAEDLGLQASFITKKESLQEVLLRQLGICVNSDEDSLIGREIIGNIDENGYLKAGINEIAAPLNVNPQKAENILKLIQEFEPAGVGARTVSECLLIQLDLAGESSELARKIVRSHIEDVARKNYKYIARALNEPQDKVDAAIQKILRLNPKPGSSYSAEEIQQVIPDIIINERGENELEIIINNEDIPALSINKDYRQMLKNDKLDAQTKEFLAQKLRRAMEILKSISRRQATLRSVVEVVVEYQREAVSKGLFCLKPLALRQVAQKINMHETTVCRGIMNKYVHTPNGVVALKEFFPGRVQGIQGRDASSSYVKGLINDFIAQEDKKRPLSDKDIGDILIREYGLKLARRTVAKYREELRMPSSALRRER